MSVVLPKSALDDLKEFCAFHGIDLEWNAPLFRRAAQANESAFIVTFAQLAAAIRDDRRHGLARRMREAAAKDRDKRQQERKQGFRR